MSLWAPLAFISWHYESNCGVFFSSACLSQYWYGIRWVALLKWVELYQTLLAGLAALAAGKFALTAAQHSTANAIKLENAKSRNAATIACSIVADEFRDAVNELSKVVGAGTILLKQPVSPFIQSQAYMASLHSINPMLGSIVSSQKRDIEQSIISRRPGEEYQIINEMKARSYVVWHLLLMVSQRLDESGKYDLSSPERLPSGHLHEILSRSGIRPGSLVGLYSLFEWPET